MLSSDTRDRIVCMPGWDKLHDLCLVIGELTAAMLAGSALHRGMATMVLNLVSHTTSHAYDPSTEPLHGICLDIIDVRCYGPYFTMRNNTM